MANNTVIPLNSTSSSMSSLILVQQELTGFTGIFLVLGVTGNMLNCFVFLQRRLRSNACAMLFTAASASNIIMLLWGVGLSLYSINNVSPDTYNLLFCKLRMYIRHNPLVITRWYITFACLVCYALSSERANLRALCRPRLIIRSILLIALVWFLIPSYMVFTNTIVNKKCVMSTGAAQFYAFQVLILNASIPMTLMITFSLLTYRNLHRMRNRVQPFTTGQPREPVGVLRNQDRQFIRMLFAQIVANMLPTLLYTAYTFYSAISVNISDKSDYRVAVESFVNFLVINYLLNVNATISFFVFFFSSKVFRRELKLAVGKVIPCSCLVNPAVDVNAGSV